MIGLIGQKIGMTQIFLENGNIVPVSVIKIEKNLILNKRTEEKDGYSALVLGYGDISDKKLAKPYKGQFKNDLKPKRYIKEFRMDETEKFQVGQELGLDDLKELNYIDVVGMSKGKGYQGVMKRHGFHGGRATHGSKFHRVNGSTGQNTYPGHCFKGVKRAGRMGFDRVTVQSLKIIKFDLENSVLLVKGAVPGKNKEILCIKKAVKKK
ncbi:MAG: 50S ribosomal protein L3 [Spirochaetes bacterium GWD1_27_9]|nr:MAG: 50S ribosomal protein L3 [Spirochaetes bacterium GWB1_27_13]OHD21020.1 MAG: 50S ribosomal protein L3 [Spirochaetes bacterium GWC1_27_15]OHD45381.1 MAG: 50S ribosomal protein L3 [Spirochaetes bacterium GWD1_27_9]